MTVKMPEPMTAPMPSAVSDHGPRVFLKRVFGFCRVLDQLIDGLAGAKLTEQGSSPRSAHRRRRQIAVPDRARALAERPGTLLFLQCGA